MGFRARLQELLMKDPVYVSLSMRWLGWLIALGIVVAGAAPESHLKWADLVLGVTLCQLVMMTGYRLKVKGRVTAFQGMERHIGLPILDLTIALWSVYQTGGWGSPFYHFGFTSVLAPSLRYGLLGAVGSSTFYTVGYIFVVAITPDGFDPAYLDGGRPSSSLITAPLNPVLTALYAAFLSELLQKLHTEHARAEQLAAAQERARLARDIHDGVSQTLFMLTMSLETGQVMAQKEKAEKTARHLDSLAPVAQKALLELRNAMYNVEPLAAGEQTLVQAASQLARDYVSATGQKIEVKEEEGYQAPGEVASGVFRMIQEALANACQHSGGDAVEIVFGQPEAGAVSIVDNGEGFDMESVSQGRGLKNLQERAAEMGVRYELKSGDGGTTVTITWGEG